MIQRLILLVLLAFSSIGIHAREVILKYDSHIEVNRDRSFRVTETIRVRVEGKDIKRGIYRDFPTVYKPVGRPLTRVLFEVESVSRNGKPEKYVIESAGTNGKRVKIGRKEHRTKKGRVHL